MLTSNVSLLGVSFLVTSILVLDLVLQFCSRRYELKILLGVCRLDLTNCLLLSGMLYPAPVYFRDARLGLGMSIGGLSYDQLESSGCMRHPFFMPLVRGFEGKESVHLPNCLGFLGSINRGRQSVTAVDTWLNAKTLIKSNQLRDVILSEVLIRRALYRRKRARDGR